MGKKVKEELRLLEASGKDYDVGVVLWGPYESSNS